MIMLSLLISSPRMRLVPEKSVMLSFSFAFTEQTAPPPTNSSSTVPRSCCLRTTTASGVTLPGQLHQHGNGVGWSRLGGASCPVSQALLFVPILHRILPLCNVLCARIDLCAPRKPHPRHPLHHVTTLPLAPIARPSASQWPDHTRAPIGNVEK